MIASTPPHPSRGGGRQRRKGRHSGQHALVTIGSSNLESVGKTGLMDTRWLLVRHVMAGFGVGLVLIGCGGGGLSLSEYVDRVNAIGDRTNPQVEALVGELEQSRTPEDVKTTMDGMVALRVESVAATEALEPPEQIADLHDLFVGWEARLLLVEEALAARAGAVTGWEEFFVSSELEAYRAALVEGKQVCIEFQTRLDATAERGVFADIDWLPGELTEAVEAVLGCDLFPENPENVFRPVPATPEPST